MIEQRISQVLAEKGVTRESIPVTPLQEVQPGQVESPQELRQRVRSDVQARMGEVQGPTTFENNMRLLSELESRGINPELLRSIADSLIQPSGVVTDPDGGVFERPEGPQAASPGLSELVNLPGELITQLLEQFGVTPEDLRRRIEGGSKQAPLDNAVSAATR